MAAPGFGFSAGDFIAAVSLIAKTSKALKDAGGAAEDYRRVVVELDILHEVISELLPTYLVPPSAQNTPDPIAKCAKQQADLILQTLQEFSKLVSKFDAKLGAQAKSGWFRGAGRKTQWAIIQAQDVEKLRVKIGTQLSTLVALLQILDKYVFPS